MAPSVSAPHSAELLRAESRDRRAGYDLSINRYKEVVHEAAEHRPPKEIIAELKVLEREIADGLVQLEGLLS